MPIKQYTVFRCLLQLSAKYGSNNFTRLYSSLFTHKTYKERYRTHTPYADTSVLQTLCVESALGLALTKGTCIKEEKKCMQYCKSGYLSVTDKNYN